MAIFHIRLQPDVPTEIQFRPYLMKLNVFTAHPYFWCHSEIVSVCCLFCYSDGQSAGLSVIGLSDPEAKEKYLLSLIESLPEPNHSTVVYLIDHLIR